MGCQRQACSEVGLEQQCPGSCQGVGSNTSFHPPAHIPYHSLECLLSIGLRAPSWASGVCGVLPLRCASWHMPVVGSQRVMDFPPAWGEVGVCLQALVAPEVVCRGRA